MYFLYNNNHPIFVVAYEDFDNLYRLKAEWNSLNDSTDIY